MVRLAIIADGCVIVNYQLEGVMWLLLSMALAHADDCKVYRSDYASYSNLVATVKGDKIYKGDYASYSNLLGTGKDCSMSDLGFAAGVLLVL